MRQNYHAISQFYMCASVGENRIMTVPVINGLNNPRLLALTDLWHTLAGTNVKSVNHKSEGASKYVICDT